MTPAMAKKVRDRLAPSPAGPSNYAERDATRSRWGKEPASASGWPPSSSRSGAASPPLGPPSSAPPHARERPRWSEGSRAERAWDGSSNGSRRDHEHAAGVRDNGWASRQHVNGSARSAEAFIHPSRLTAGLAQSDDEEEGELREPRSAPSARTSRDAERSSPERSRGYRDRERANGRERDGDSAGYGPSRRRPSMENGDRHNSDYRAERDARRRSSPSRRSLERMARERDEERKAGPSSERDEARHEDATLPDRKPDRPARWGGVRTLESRLGGALGGEDRRPEAGPADAWPREGTGQHDRRRNSSAARAEDEAGPSQGSRDAKQSADEASAHASGDPLVAAAATAAAQQGSSISSPTTASSARRTEADTSSTAASSPVGLAKDKENSPEREQPQLAGAVSAHVALASQPAPPSTPPRGPAHSRPSLVNGDRLSQGGMTPKHRLSSDGVPLGPRALYSRAPSSSDGGLPPPPPPPVEDEPPPPPPRSFSPASLPNELDVKLRLKNWRISYDPALDKRPSKEKKSKEVIRKYVSAETLQKEVTDPRRRSGDAHVAAALSQARKRIRSSLHLIKYEWDSNSAGPKPPPPPRGLVVSGLSPLTTLNYINTQFRRFGRFESAELKTDRTGESTGVYYVRFAHDFDEEGKAIGSAGQRGDEAAKQAKAAMDGARIGSEIAKVVFAQDRTLYEKTYRELLAKKYPSRPKPAATMAAAASSSGAAASPLPINAPPPNAPRGPRRNVAPVQTPSRSMVGKPNPLDLQKATAAAAPSVAAPSPMSQHLRAQQHLSGPGSASPRTPLDAARRANAGEDIDMKSRDEASPVAIRRGPVNVAASAPTQVFYGSRGSGWRPGDGTGSSGAGAAPDPLTESTEKILYRLSLIGMPYVFIPRIKSSSITHIAMARHFNGFLPAEVAADENGWYVAFNSKDAAHRAKMVMDRSHLHGYHLTIEVRLPPPRPDGAEEPELQRYVAPAPTPAAVDPVPAPPPPPPPPKPPKLKRKVVKTWSDAELMREAQQIITRELADMFARDVKNRLLTPFIADFLLPTSKGGEALYAPPPQPEPALAESMATEEEEDLVPGKLKSFRKKEPLPRQTSPVERKQKLKKRWDQRPGEELVVPPQGQEDAVAHADEMSPADSMMTDSVAATPVTAVTALETEPDSAKAEVVPAVKAKKAKKKVKIVVEQAEEDEAETPEAVVEAAVVERVEAPSLPQPKPAKKAKLAAPSQQAKAAAAVARAKSPTPDPFALGLAEDEEELYYVKVALERMAAGESVTAAGMPEKEGVDGEAEPHTSGSARTEGFYKIQPSEKAEHLPDRNKAVVDPATAVGLASARDNRADSRRFVQGIEQHRKETATDTDILKFNQLRTRKKQLKFAKSPIHDWGLYAMELIPAGDMVIEYVGEVIRQQVADEREKQYERQGNFSTYLFRVDDDLVVDATRKGNIARLMNHCCTPNCNAKILTLNGEKRIVLYAKNMILPGQELTYDYKFQSTGDETDAIPCLCGSPGCRRFL